MSLEHYAQVSQYTCNTTPHWILHSPLLHLEELWDHTYPTFTAPTAFPAFPLSGLEVSVYQLASVFSIFQTFILELIAWLPLHAIISCSVMGSNERLNAHD